MLYLKYMRTFWSKKERPNHLHYGGDAIPVYYIIGIPWTRKMEVHKYSRTSANTRMFCMCHEFANISYIYFTSLIDSQEWSYVMSPCLIFFCFCFIYRQVLISNDFLLVWFEWLNWLLIFFLNKIMLHHQILLNL